MCSLLFQFLFLFHFFLFFFFFLLFFSSSYFDLRLLAGVYYFVSVFVVGMLFLCFKKTNLNRMLM